MTDQCLIQKQLIEVVVKTFENMEQSRQVKITGKGRGSTPRPEMCHILVQGGHRASEKICHLGGW